MEWRISFGIISRNLFLCRPTWLRSLSRISPRLNPMFTTRNGGSTFTLAILQGIKQGIRIIPLCFVRYVTISYQVFERNRSAYSSLLWGLFPSSISTSEAGYDCHSWFWSRFSIPYHRSSANSVCFLTFLYLKVPWKIGALLLTGLTFKMEFSDNVLRPEIIRF